MHTAGSFLVALAVTVTAAYVVSPVSYRHGTKPKPNNNDSAGGNIIGGQVAEPGSTPWLASIQDKNYDIPVHYCGATILSHFWLLTAASCVNMYMPEELQVVVGEYDFTENEGYEKVRSVLAIFVHPKFDYFTQPAYDVAMMLISPFYYNDWISPIPLPPPCFLVLPGGAADANSKHPSACANNRKHNLEGLEGVIAGWGETADGQRPSLVMEASMTILSNEECQAAYPSYEMDSLMCAANITHGGTDACVGDSGGGLVSKEGFLLGVYSYEQPCGNINQPGLYVNISTVHNWICDITGNYYTNVLESAGYTEDISLHALDCI